MSDLKQLSECINGLPYGDLMEFCKPMDDLVSEFINDNSKGIHEIDVVDFATKIHMWAVSHQPTTGE